MIKWYKKKLEILHNPSLKRKVSPCACTLTDSSSLLPRALRCYPPSTVYYQEASIFCGDRGANLRFGRYEGREKTSQRVNQKKHVFFPQKSPTKKCKMPGCSFYTMNKRFALFPWSANPLLWFRDLKSAPRLGKDGSFPIIRGCGYCNV